MNEPDYADNTFIVLKITVEKDLDGNYEDAITEPLDILGCEMQFARDFDICDIFPCIMKELETGVYGFYIKTIVEDGPEDTDVSYECNYYTKYYICPACGDVSDVMLSPSFPVCEKHRNDNPAKTLDAIIANVQKTFFDNLHSPKAPNPYVMELHMEGNNGGDYIYITQTAEQVENSTFFIEVGHCCVVVLCAVLPVEYLTALFNQQIMDTHLTGDELITEIVRRTASGWPKDFVDSLVAKTREVSWHSN